MTLAEVPDPRIALTSALVEANSFEQLMLWCRHATDGSLEECDRRDRAPRVEWVQDNKGFWLQVGVRDGAPVCVTLFWSTVGGQLVCFWEPTSEVVDFAMVRSWLARTFPESIRRCDAMNFHNAFDSWPPKAKAGAA